MKLEILKRLKDIDTVADKIKSLIQTKSQDIKDKKIGELEGTQIQCKTEMIQDAGIEVEGDEVIRVKTVANMFLYLDHDMDILTEGCAKKSIQEKGPEGADLIYHIKDHSRKITDKVGEVRKIYTEEMTINGKTGIALIFETDIYKSYDEKLFNMYKRGGVKQHSIGLQYVQIELAVNDPTQEAEFKVWTAWIDKIINKEKAEKHGFFWVIKEIKLIENSAVLLGSNEATPTLNISEPSEDSPKNDSADANQKELKKQFYLNILKT